MIELEDVNVKKFRAGDVVRVTAHFYANGDDMFGAIGGVVRAYNPFFGFNSSWASCLVRFSTSDSTCLIGSDKLELATCKESSHVAPAQSENDTDPVNHPSHYQITTKDGTHVEVIDIIRARFGDDYLLGNVAKYLLRAGHKDDLLQDLRKARVYLDWRIKELDGE